MCDRNFNGRKFQKRNSLLLISNTNTFKGKNTYCRARSKKEKSVREIMSKYNITKKPVDATPLFTNNINSNNFESILNEYRHKNQFLFKDTSEDIEFFNQIIHK